jgi:hypothetical protein
MDDDCNPLETILKDHAVRFQRAPYASRVARLARTAASIPEALIDDLAELIVQLDDTELVGNDLALHLVDVAYCGVRVVDAVDFASAFRSRLQRYLRSPEVAEAARENFTPRIGWWKAAIGRAFETRKWPAVVLVGTTFSG